MWAKGKLKGTV